MAACFAFFFFPAFFFFLADFFLPAAFLLPALFNDFFFFFDAFFFFFFFPPFFAFFFAILNLLQGCCTKEVRHCWPVLSNRRRLLSRAGLLNWVHRAS